MSRRVFIVIVFILLAGCQVAAEQTPFAATLPVESSATEVVVRSTPVPTANPLPSRTATLPPTLTYTPSPTATVTPSPTITPSPTATLSPTPAPTSTPIASATPTDPFSDPNFTPPPTWTPPPANASTQIADHYVFGRPIPEQGRNFASRVYPYGSTAGGRLQIHKGVDMENPTGTTVLAAGDGVVFFAGDDLTTMFGPINNFYGNMVVLQHNISDNGQTVYTLYGHMNTLRVQAGQVVARGDVLGTVGGTGVALGPHLHFEVRVGDPYSYGATRNPELWIRPYPTFGTLAGIVTDADGNRLFDVTLQVRSTDISRFAFSYHDTSVNPDTVFNENFVLGDLPANYYEVTVSDNGRVRFRQIVYVYPNRTTWLQVTLNR
jgi:murein DD-endopeptidase MepM/ murein hydrolase activator NlpD